MPKRYTRDERIAAAIARRQKRTAAEAASRIARHCTVCGKWFMSAPQKTHHDANAARLCVQR